MSVITHLHASGEVFEATNLEAAHGICPVLGKMTLEEAGLLFELQAMGKEQIADQQNVQPEKPVVVKIERVHPKQTVEPAIKESGDTMASEQLESDLHAIMLVNQIEAGRTVKDTRQEPEEANVVYITKTKPIENRQLTPLDEYDINLRDESPLEVQAFSEREAVDAPPVITDMMLSSATEAITEPLQFEPGEEIVSVYEAEIGESESLTGDEQVIDHMGLETTDFLPIIESDTQDYFEVSNDGTFAKIIEATQFIEVGQAEFIEAESLPAIVIAELPAPIDQIETTMVQLVEVLENDETTEINAIIEEIITLPTKREVIAGGGYDVLEEMLEELFVKLFERGDISYSPDLVESFVKLTKSHYLGQLLEIASEPEGAADLPHEIGTREFLQKLQHGLSAMKQTVINFYEIGKSILRLCTYNCEGSPVMVS